MKALDVALVRPVDDAVRVNEPAVPVIVQPANVARPLVVVGVLQPVRVPVPEAMARATEAVELVTVLPEESSTVTTGWVVNAVLFTAPKGWVVTMSFVAAPKVRVMAFELAPVREVEAALMVNEPAVPVSEQPLKVATPDEAVAVRPPVLVHDRVPELLTDRVTLAAELATVLPPES